MVDFESPFACRSRRLDGAANSPENTMGMGTSQTSSEKPHDRGMDLEKTSRLRSKAELFLEVPLIELIEPRFGFVLSEIGRDADRSFDSHGGDLIVVHTRYDEAQHRAIKPKRNCPLRMKQFDGVNLHSTGQYHADGLLTQRVDGAQPAMVGIRVRVIEQVDGVTRCSFPGKEFEESITVNLDDGLILSNPADSVVQ